MATVSIKKLPASEIEITGEIDAAVFEAEYTPAVKHFQLALAKPGFRPGHLPEDLVVREVGEDKILLEMAERTLAKEYPAIIAAEKIDVLGRPEISLTKLARGNPLGFKIKTAVMPEIKLTDYKTLAKNIRSEQQEPTQVSAEEVDKVVGELQAERGKKSATPDNLPALTDEFAQSLGPFSSLTDLKDKIKENLQYDKNARAKEKLRLKIMEAIIADSTLPVPPVMLASELDKMAHETKSQISQLNLKFEDYLQKIGKTEDDLRREWKDEALKRVHFGLVLHGIIQAEKITPSEEDINREIAQLVKHYPEAEPTRLHAYAASLVANEKAFAVLET